MVKRLLIQTDEASADGVDDEGNFFRFFDYEGHITVSEVTLALGCPGMTLAQEDYVYSEDAVFGLKSNDALFEETSGSVIAMRLRPSGRP